MKKAENRPCLSLGVQFRTGKTRTHFYVINVFVVKDLFYFSGLTKCYYTWCSGRYLISDLIHV